MKLGCIVEGDGEVEAVPALLRRLVARLDPTVVVDTTQRVLRVSKGKLLRAGAPDELARSLEILARRLSGEGAILILLDADDDLPCVLGPQLLARARSLRPDVPVGVVIANREYEAWFLAGADSLAGRRGLPADLSAPEQPEGIRGAKEWLTRKLGRRYSETRDQAAFTALLDLDAARAAASFDKLAREVERLFHLAATPWSTPPAASGHER